MNVLLTVALTIATALAQPGPSFSVEQEFTAGHLLKHHRNASFTSPGIRARSLPPKRLAWVTPWNPAGYDRTLRHPRAFTHVAPCWFEAKLANKQEPGGPLKLAVFGAGQVNASWAEGLKALTNGDTKILPRLTLPIESWGKQGSRLLTDAASSVAAAQVIADALSGGPAGAERKFSSFVDGIALEWGHMPLTGQKRQAGVRRFLTDLRQQLADALEVDDVTVLLVTPPDPKRAGGKQIATLEPAVDLFAVMTYDYNAASERPKENAPMLWVADIMNGLARDAPRARSKLLVGLNLYGYRFSATPGPPTAATGADIVRILGSVRQRAKVSDPSLTTRQLRERPGLSWGTEAKEHSFEHYIPKKGVEWVFMPSVAALLHRTQFAAENGFGVSLWELGQGLEYFTPIFNPAS